MVRVLLSLSLSLSFSLSPILDRWKQLLPRGQFPFSLSLSGGGQWEILAGHGKFRGKHDRLAEQDPPPEKILSFFGNSLDQTLAIPLISFLGHIST